MHRTASSATPWWRLALTLLVGTLVALALPPTLSTDTSSTVVLASLSLLAAALVCLGSLVVASAALVPAGSTTRTVEQPLHHPARVTDPVHHPIRPRAPGC